MCIRDSDNLDFFLDVRELGEELGFGVALKKIGGDGVTGFVSSGKLLHVGIVKEDLGLENLSSRGSDVGFVSKGEV